MTTKATRRVWTVVYPDVHDIVGLGVAHFDDEANARMFADTHHGTIREEDVPRRIADQWTFTRWVSE